MSSPVWARVLPLGIGALLALGACGDGGEDVDFSSTEQPVTGVSASESEASTDSSTTADTGEKLDIGTSGTGTGTDEGSDPPGCKKVDFLFVIDNSGSMLEEQNALIDSFDDFIGSIDQTIEAEQDYHIMVVDTDAWVYSQCPFLCTGFGGCLTNPQFNCGTPCMDDTACVGLGSTETCGGNGRCDGTQTVPLQCENILGAGVTYPRGADASNTDCNFSTGKRYMDSSEGIALIGKFSCAAQVGTGSTEDPEKPMGAMVEAVVEDSSAVATCNDGFLRNDAILVVTFITDEDDNDGDGSSGSPQQWYDRMVAAKNGDPSAVVMLGIYGSSGCAEPSARLDQFMTLWGDQGLKGDVCASNYGAFFQQAVDLIDTTCDGFVPPG